MKRIMVCLAAFVLSAVLCLGSPAGAEGTGQAAVTGGNAVPKVILDTDIAYVNDDAIAMFVLAQADRAGMVKFLGVTTAGGNVFIPEATTAALRQLELIGRTSPFTRERTSRCSGTGTCWPNSGRAGPGNGLSDRGGP